MAVGFFGQYLLNKELIDPMQLAEGIELQEKTNQKIGQILKSKNLLTEDKIEIVLELQKNKNLLFGEIAQSQLVRSKALLQFGPLFFNSFQPALVVVASCVIKDEIGVGRSVHVHTCIRQLTVESSGKQRFVVSRDALVDTVLKL